MASNHMPAASAKLRGQQEHPFIREVARQACAPATGGRQAVIKASTVLCGVALHKPSHGLLVRSHFGGEEAIKPAALPTLLA
jgi:hypothetical protein